MFKKLVPVVKQRHQNITLAPVIDYSFANKLHSASLAIIEFPVACVHLPIVFLKEQEKMFPHLFMGIKPGQNLCVDEKGSWIGGYMPLAVKRYPFSLRENCGSFPMINTFN